MTSIFGKIITIIIPCCLFETVSSPVGDPNYDFNFHPLPRQLLGISVPVLPQRNFGIQISLPGPRQGNKPYKNNDIDFKQIQPNGMLHVRDKVNFKDKDNFDLNNSDYKNTEYNIFKSDHIEQEDAEKETEPKINNSDHNNIKYNVFKSELNENEFYLKKEDDDIKDTLTTEFWATDNTTEVTSTTNNDYYESTPEDDVFNRIAAPPAVVASLLG